MAESQYLLFDVPSKNGSKGSWSPNAWKTRLLLNYKKLEFQTQWVEYPDIKGALENHVPPNDDNPPYSYPYSIPAIKSPDGTYVMDSGKIAHYIESQSPSPALHLDSDYLQKVESLWTEMGVFAPIFVPLVPKVLLNERSADYFHATREQAFGMSLDQVAEKLGGETAWNNTQLVLTKFTELLKENEGPYFMGATPSYADLVWGGVLLFLECLGKEILEEALKRSGDAQVHRDLLAAIRRWA